MKLIVSNLLAVTFMAGHVAAQCSICPDGVSLTDPGARLLPETNAFSQTCGEIEANLSGSARCEEDVSTQNSEFDYTGFCCGVAGQAGSLCNFCPQSAYDPAADNLVPELNEVDEDGIPLIVNPGELNCAAVKSIADYTLAAATESCIALSNVAKEGCCTTPVPSCSLCEGGGTYGEGGKAMPGQTLTCEEFDATLATKDTNSQCNAAFNAFQDYDIQAYCGCTAAEPPATCDFCEFDLTDRDALVTGTGGLKCSEFEKFAPFITDIAACANWQECCAPETTTPPVIVQKSSASGISFVAATVLGLLTVFAQQ